MSEMEGIDQNGGAIDEVLSNEDMKNELLEAINSKSAPSDTNKNTMEDTDRLSDTNTQNDTLNKKDPLESKSQLSECIMNENQAAKEKINKSTNENEDTTVKTDIEEAAKSRELKSLLALSKEAKLETNLSRKRKSFGQRKKVKSESRSSTGKAFKIQYPVTAESELEMELQAAECSKQENKEEDSISVSTTPKAAKRKKTSLSDTSGDGITDEAPRKSRKSLTNEVAMFKPNKDMFCWRCHKDGVNISCETCPRSYHHRCLKQTINDPNHWPCPECVSILKAESTQTRSPAMKGMTLEHLCSLLKFAVNRMIQCQGSEPFIHAVNDNEFPDYKKYIIQPMDLTLLEKNIKENLYGSTQAFEADAKWILHNSIIFNSYQSKLTTAAKGIIKVCKQEMAEIENCPSCYLNANTKKKTWFVEVCPKPHLLVWAKLRGFPFWPGKAMSCKDGTVDVRFFGAHDRAWVPEKECFLYSPKDPNGFRVKRADIEQCVEELNVHVENLKKIYGEFSYPQFKTPLDPDNETKQLQIFLPRYRSYFNKHRFAKRQSMEQDRTENKQKTEMADENSKEKESERKDMNKEALYNKEDEAMEGYGTDDETMPEIDTEMRKTLLTKSENDTGRENHEAEEDDTQVPTNIEPDTSGIDEVLLSEGSLQHFLADGEAAIPKSDSEPSSKRPSFDDSSPHSAKLFRRNSETKTESNRISNKINRIDISENMEISLGNDDKGSVGYSDNISSSNSECSSDFSVEIKKKPVQVDVDNAEFTISPASKLKMVDKLIKRLSDGESSSGGSSISDKVEQVKTNLYDEKLSVTTDSIEKPKEVVRPTEETPDKPEASSPSIKKKFEDPVSSTDDDNNEDSSPTKVVETSEEKDDVSDKKESISEPKEQNINNDESVEQETINNKKDQEKESDDLQMNSADELVHEELDINDTKLELDISESRHNTADDDEISESSDETSTDENKPLSVLAKDVAHKPTEDKTVPKLKIVIKAVRTEETLDQLMKKSLETEKSLNNQEEDEMSKSPVRRSREMCDKSDSKQSEEEDTEASSKSNKHEISNSTEIKSPQTPTISFKIHSPEKSSTKLIIRAMHEKPKEPSREDPVWKESKSPLKESSASTAKNISVEASEESGSKSDKKENEKSPIKLREKQKEVNIVKDIDDDEAMDTMTEVDLNIDKAKIINIIHSSLNDSTTSASKSADVEKDPEPPAKTASENKPSATGSKKRKMSHEENGESLDLQNKMLKLVSIESIMNKANNNQDDNRDKSEGTSILKTSLQTKKIVRSVSTQDSPSSSTRSSLHEIQNEEIKSEPDSEAESNNPQDLEAKKKYLSALNILEKGEADAHKLKPNEIRTRSKTEEKRERFRVSNDSQVVDNMTKIIEDVAVNYSAVHEGEALPPAKKKPPPLSSSKPDGCEIYVKSFAKIVPDTPEANNTVIPVAPLKQRARKSFPHPNYARPMMKPTSQPGTPKEQPKISPSTPTTPIGNEAILRVTPRTSIAAPISVATTMATLTPQNIPKAAVPPLQPMEGVRPANGYLILQPPQQENLLLLPPNQTINYTSTMPNQMLSMTPCLVSAPTHNPTIRQIQPPQIWNPGQNQSGRDLILNVSESQNYIPQGEIGGKNSQASNSTVRNTASGGSRKLVNGLPEPALISSVMETSANAISASPSSSNNAERTSESVSLAVPERQPLDPEVITENGETDEFGILNSLIPENVTRAVSEVIRRPPPKLKPRPPGVFSQQFSEGVPSSAGTVTAKINSVAHRLGDYFRGMLIETLDDLGKTSNAEATITCMKLEIEALKHKHSIELSEIEKNMGTILRDIQRSIIDDRERIIEETRAACEVESIKRVEEAKSKQWCANCSKEAQFYCCWNTSYCDYPCQQKHWPNHMSKCTQNINQSAQIAPTGGIRPGSQQLILRPANPPPKGGLGRVFTKPIQKVYMNRNITAPKTMRVQTSAGNLLTMMETTPGNYQLMSSNSLVRTSNPVANIQKTNLISVTSAVSTSITTSSQQKNIQPKQPVRILSHPIPVTTILEEDSD